MRNEAIRKQTTCGDDKPYLKILTLCT